jgi:hypothetical protein
MQSAEARWSLHTVYEIEEASGGEEFHSAGQRYLAALRSWMARKSDAHQSWRAIDENKSSYWSRRSDLNR